MRRPRSFSFYAVLANAIGLAFVLSPGLALAQDGATSAPSATAAPSGTPPAQTEKPQLFKIPAQPLSSALLEYSRQSQIPVLAAQTLVEGKRSSEVSGSYTPGEALKRLLVGTGLKAEPQQTGGYTLVAGTASSVDEVVVTAKRDEAETDVLVRQSSSSDRLGQSLRDQARNTEVISAQLIDDEQDQDITDALRNTGSVQVNTTNIQSGTNFSIRGYQTAGIQNGLSAPNGLSAGATTPVADIERIEVLKGPDAILAGVDNLGGTVNIVTKKPSADPFLNLGLEVGSYDSERVTVDANDALTSDKLLSGRLVATERWSDHNYAGYEGNQEYLVAPGIRFKNADTDFLLTGSLSKQFQGATPYTMLNLEYQPLPLPRTSPLFGVKDQRVEVQTALVFTELDQKITDWATFVVRGQYQAQTLDISVISPFAVLDDQGDVFADNDRTRQKGFSESADAFFRLQGSFWGIDHKLVLGGAYSNSLTKYFDASLTTTQEMNILTNTPPMPPSPPADTYNNNFAGTVFSEYLQYLLKWGPLHVTTGVRGDYYKNYAQLSDGSYFSPISRTHATSPDVGVVYDVIPTVALFASIARGFTPNYNTEFDGKILPNEETKNYEAGTKVDLLGKHVFLTASWFRLDQSNISFDDPAHQGFFIPGPGLRSQGLDLSLSGKPLPGWTVTASLTRSKYSYLAIQEDSGSVVSEEPKTQYSLYTNYIRPIADQLSLGAGIGVFGRSTYSIDGFGTYYVPSAIQMDWNGFVHYGPWEANLGVRNILNRVNYGLTTAPSYLPYLEARNWRLTITRHF
jgi:iron complex outermembrane recepter protein